MPAPARRPDGPGPLPDGAAWRSSLDDHPLAWGKMKTGFSEAASFPDGLAASLLDVLDRTPCGVLVLGSSGDVLGANRNADRMLDLAAGADHRARRDALRALLAAARAKLDPNDALFVTIRREPRPPLVLHATPVEAGGSPHTVLVLVELAHPPQPDAKVLRRLFDLTPAETRLAQAIGCGQTLAEVSRATGLSHATLRTQLASIFVKTQTRRQAELVALLAKAAILS
ncbi:LuxR family transcriptional regulator [Methylobacterium terrae]|uniref:LuxR family transcriptional regulator n=1 Tax=Methylobacterium terrae TaxID=2202827 RepID=A0A2U8WMA7_9HYPH|nr:LuxR family transcriptional regulator [Methylobacterium terrae]AWN47394.1 LuxR family transcriptional regulator [Methylobacterium terrae]